MTERDHRDAQLLAALRNLAPELLAVVEAARAQRNRPMMHELRAALRALDAKVDEVMR